MNWIDNLLKKREDKKKKKMKNKPMFLYKDSKLKPTIEEKDKKKTTD